MVGHDKVTLAFVTGRHRALVEEAIDEYDLPLPDFVIGDVGTSILEGLVHYRPELDKWIP